jgi:hypothetical protein
LADATLHLYLMRLEHLAMDPLLEPTARPRLRLRSAPVSS